MIQERRVSVIEAAPFHKDYGRKKYFLASAAEREEMKSTWPTYSIRLATEDEVDSLQGKPWDQLEKEELDWLVALD